MTKRNNIRSKVVFLVVLVLFLISACTLPSANNQANRPSSLNQNKELAPYFDRIEALLRSNEDNEEKQPQTTATSIPTHIHTSPSWPTKTQAQFLIKTNIITKSIEGFFCLKNSNLLTSTNPVGISNLGLIRLSTQLLTMSLFEPLGGRFF